MSRAAINFRPGGMARPDCPVVVDDCIAPESVYNIVTKRIRMARTLFGDNVKLVLRQLEDEQWAHLAVPYLLVVPTVSRPQVTTASEDLDSIVNLRTITMIAQLPGRGSEAEWMAANDIEIVEKQLLRWLLGWRPYENYQPTAYSGMRVSGTRLPDVRVSFSFQFPEFVAVADVSKDVVGIDPPEFLELEGFRVSVMNDTCCSEEE